LGAPGGVGARGGAPATGHSVRLADFGACEELQGTREQLLEPHDRDCRFERQLGEALDRSGILPRADRPALPTGESTLTVEPRRVRVAFQRQVIPGVKPLLVLTLFTYLWTPLPFEVDEESYDLRLAIVDSHGQLISEVAVVRTFSHRLSAYSPERTPPPELLASLRPAERDLAPVVVCRGPHAHLAVAELIQQLAGALQRSETREPKGLLEPSGRRGRGRTPVRRRQHLAAKDPARSATLFLASDDRCGRPRNRGGLTA
jgi:hypothetical protein